jgi:hypothetical protein
MKKSYHLRKKRYPLLALLLFAIALFLPKWQWAQGTSYKMDFVNAAQIRDKKNHIIAVFKVSPLIQDFKLIMSMRVTYEIGKGEKTINVQKQKEDNIHITVCGSNVKEKHQLVYELVKDHVRLEEEKDMYLIVFDFFDITQEKIDRMSITYGLWESNNPDVRTEKKYDFEIGAKP